jgi:release factor glutamine methyltransferase
MTTTFSIAEALKQYILLDFVSDSARLDLEVLLAAVLQKDRSYLYTWPEKCLSTAQNQQFVDYLQRRINGEPIAYIIGEKEFWSLSLSVNSSTLIPRPETELLVETALSLFGQDPESFCRSVIDLGTGTGAIALALASEKPQWNILAVDSNAQACELAEKNRQKHQCDNITVQCSDWFSAIDERSVDIIVSNPPYIDETDPHLTEGDVRFEPRSALTAGNNGLADIDIIAAQSRPYLLPNGWLLIEHGYQQAPAVLAILQQYHYQQCRTMHDMAGHPRITLGQAPNE